MAKVQIHDWVIVVTFIAVDLSTLYPLFGSHWMCLLGVDVSRLIQAATQIHNMNSVITPYIHSNYWHLTRNRSFGAVAICKQLLNSVLKLQLQLYMKMGVAYICVLIMSYLKKS